MTTITEDWTLVDQVNSDPSPLPHMHRVAAYRAVLVCAQANDGMVHASLVRELTPDWVRDKVRGAVMSSLVSRGILVADGPPRRSHDRRNRNDKRWLSTYQVADWARLADAVEAVA